METHRQKPSPDDATQALEGLSADRDRLAASIRVPWVLLAGFGAVAAWWVSSAASTSPGADYEPSATGGLVLAIVLVISYLVQQEIGVRFKSMGLQAGLALVGIVVSCLVLFSISLGLVSFGLRWAVTLTSIAAFALTTCLASVAYRSAAQKLRHG